MNTYNPLIINYIQDYNLNSSFCVPLVISMDVAHTAIAQRGSQNLVFNHKDMDYYFSWIIGREATSGSLKEECLEAASQMVDGDYKSWQSAWIGLAERI